MGNSQVRGPKRGWTDPSPPPPRYCSVIASLNPWL